MGDLVRGNEDRICNALGAWSNIQVFGSTILRQINHFQLIVRPRFLTRII